jgi:hypothetical protein
MPTILVAIICIAMIVVGGMTLSQGVLTSADSAALSVDEITVREGEMARTHIAIESAAQLTWEDLLRVTLLNSGQSKLAGFDKWDFIVRYYDSSGNVVTEWLPYTASTLNNNEWQKARIGLNGPIEFFEPGILNPLEEMVLLAKLSPLPGDGTMMNITLATPNGVFDSKSINYPGYTLFTPHTGNTTISSTSYFNLEEASNADANGLNLVQIFVSDESGNKLLYNENQSSQKARFVFPLVGINRMPASTWVVHYRCLASGGGQFPQQDGDVGLNIDVLIRQADGAIRTTIDNGAASVNITQAEENTWVSKSATYDFPGYTVIDTNDYLEIDYYASTGLGPGGDVGEVKLKVDDITLDQNDQTRIEG